MNKRMMAGLAMIAGLCAVARSQAPEIQRYRKIRKM
jgi:hypothetical protein